MKNQLFTKVLSVFLIAVLALITLPIQAAEARPLNAITIPVTWTQAYNVAAGTGTGYNFATPNGTNRILVVGITTNSDGSGTVGNPTTMTYGGQALTLATGNGGATTGRMHTWLYYLKDTPAVMDNTSRPLNVTMGAAGGGYNFRNMTVFYAVYAGVDQAAAIATGNGLNNTGSVGPAQLSAALTVNAGQQAVYISSVHNDNDLTIPTYTLNANWTSTGNNTGTYNPAGNGNDRAWRNEVASSTVSPGNNAATSNIAPGGNIIRYAISAMTLPMAAVVGTPPTVTTQAVSAIGAATATGNGNITALGTPNPTQYGVVWDTAANPTVALATKTAQGPIAVTGAFTSAITGLTPSTLYYVRAYATNPSGTSYGTEVTFTTAATLTVTGPANITYGSTGTITTSGGSGTGAMSYSHGTSTGCTVNTSTGVITVTNASGICTVTATKAADGTYNSATSANFGVTLNKANQIITFAAPISPAAYNSTFSVAPISNSGLAVTVTPSGACSILVGTVTMTSGTGTCTLTASQAGNANYNAATDVVQTVAAQKINQTITFAAPVSPAAYNSTFSVAPTSNSGLTVTVTPTGACSILAGTVTMTSGTSTCTLTASQAGNANYNAATDVVRTVTAQKINQTITFAAPVSPAAYNSTFSVAPTSNSGLTVTVTPTGACSILAGTVTMTSGTGTCTLTASQAGNANYNAAADVVWAVTAQMANQTITFAVPVSPAAYNSTFTVTPTSNSGLAVTVTPSGACSILGSTVTMTSGTGTCTLTASQAGNANYNAATDVTQTITAQKANQTITFVAPISPAAYNSTFSVAPTSDSSLAVTVTPSGVCSILAGTVTMTSSTGTCTLTASQAGNANYNAATDVVRTITAQVANQIITFAAPVSPAAYNSTFTVTPTSDSGLTVTVTPSGACSILGSTVTITSGAGTCTLTASQAGNVNYNAATDVVRTVTAQKSNQIITFAVPVSPATYNSTFTVAPTSDSGLTVTVTPTGSCSILAGIVTMTSGTGTCTLTASQAGNANYNTAADVVRTVTAQKINQTITFAAPVSPAAYNSTFSVAPTSDSSLTVTVTPTGSCSILGNTVTITSGTGTCTLTASQAGNANYSAATDVVRTVTAQKINQTITFAAPVSPAAYNSTFTVTPTSDSGLTVTVTPTGSCSILGNTVTITSGTGTCTLTASQAGNINYNAATDIVQTVSAQKINQTITFAAPVSPAAYNSTFSIAPTSDSGLTVTVTPTGSCSILAGTVTMTSGTGTCTLTASQAGNGNYNAAADVVQTVSAQKINQTITFTAPVSPAAYNSTFSVAPTSNSGLTVTVTPSGACSILAGTVTMTSGTGTCTLTASQAGNGNYNAAADIVRIVTAQKTNQSITFTAPVSPAAYNSTFLVAPTSDSGLTVTVTPSGSCSILAGTVTMTSGTGTCTLTASQAGNANYNAAADVVRTVSTQKINQTINVTTNAPALATSGANFTVAATGGASGNPITYTATGSCTNMLAAFTTTTTGTCTVHYNQAGDANYNAALEVTQNTVVDGNAPTVTIDQAVGQVDPTSVSPIVFDVVFSESVSDFDSTDVIITGMAGVPGVTVTTGPGTNYTVSVTGMASGETITATIASGVAHDAATNGNTASTSPSGDNSVLYDTTGPGVSVDQAVGQSNPTSSSPINFVVVFSETVTGFATGDATISGTAGATTGVVTEIAPNDGTTYNIAVNGMTSDGTVIASIPAAVAIDKLNNNNLASTNKTITYDTTAPQVTVNGINTINDTGDGVLTEFEIVTVGVTKFTVTFTEDLINVDSADQQYVNSVINPANYILVRDLGDAADFQTVSCRSGAVTPSDTKIDLSGVTYDNSAHMATFTVNGDLPLSNGNYRLFVCGTTSITDLAGLKLAGSGAAATDFTRSFAVSILNNGSSGNGGSSKKTNKNNSTISTSGLLIPVTGFAPNQTTLLPAQPADKAYKPLGEIRVEIPTLGINFPIVGVAVSQNSWNLSWLKDSVGYLEGSAYPTLAGNTVLSAHVTDANDNLGPFSDIKGMQLGQYIYIHAYGQKFIYQVQENNKILPSNISAVFKHQEYSWVTLVTCEEYDAKTALYKYRRMVRAVLISVVPEK